MEQVGSVDASAILLPFLRSPRIHIIGTITTAEYHQFIEPKLELLSQFEKIDIAPPSYDQVMDILLDVLPSYEFRSRVFVPYRTLKEAVILGGRYLKDKNFPLLGIELIDQLTTSLAARGRDFAKPSDVQEIISAAVHVPLGEVGGAEKEKLLNLEDLLHKRIIDQEEAISLIAQAMRRARAGVSAGKRPIGSFLFLGPTGVGKTETAKALAEVYFGSEKAMLRFDMSEYQQISSLDRLIGSPPGSPEAEAGGQLTNAVREKPFSLLLLDEIEKAHPDILNLFLQVFDEGHLTDSLGRKVDFRDTIIIATSNAGANIIREGVEKNEAFEDLRKKLMEYLMNEAIFRPEFLNRFDAVVMFKPITPENMEKVVTLMLQNLKSHLKEEKEIELVWDEKAVKNLAKKGYDPQFGARPLRRLIQDTLEADIAEKILRDELPRGSIYKVK
jgi:ATP-dependent Clp protease ATP-binding subunit ClpC